MIQIPINDVNPGEEFAFAGRWYVCAQEAALARHPAARKPSTVAAYSLGDNKNRVPVSIMMGLPVFVKRATKSGVDKAPGSVV